MRSTVLLLSACVLALAGSTGAGAEIQWAGNPVIHLDANDLAVGEATTWTNKAAPGGDFITVDELPVRPVVTESTPGQSGVAKKRVMFTRAEPYGYGDNPSAMLWENGAPASITDGAGFSVEGWVYITNDVEYQTFFSIGRRAAVPAETVNNFAFSASGGTGVRAIGMDTANLAWVEPRKGIPCYNHYAATYDSVSYTVSVYLNGELNASVTLPDPGLSIATDQPVYLGAMWFNANEKFLQQGLHQGGIAVIRVHDDVLTEAQVRSNFDAEKADYITFKPVFDKTIPVAATVRAGGTRTMAPPALLSPLVLAPPSTDITWSLAGAVPAGVAIDAATGIITIAGTVAPGTYGFTVGAANSYGSDTVAVTLTVAAVPEITVAGTLLVDVDVTVAGVSPGTLTTPLDNYGSLGGAFTPYNSPQIIALETAAGPKNVLAQSGAINLVLQDGDVNVPAPEDMTGNSGWTVEGWLQVETFAGDCPWFGWAPTLHGQHAAALLYATAGGYPAAWFSDAIGFWMFNWGPLNPNPVATDREWHYAVYTWDGTTFRTYMDGAPSVSETNPNGGLAIAPEQKIMLG
ncbi:MAG TPA: hypothetical protein DCM87_22295, partial [Planctomycetes bacterium]|nr:hypothetical protein [Planctomycetota bacterium]